VRVRHVEVAVVGGRDSPDSRSIRVNLGKQYEGGERFWNLRLCPKKVNFSSS